MLPSIDKVHDYVAGTGGEIIVNMGFKIFCFEFGLDAFAHAIPMICDCGASRISHRVDGKLHLIDELKDGLLERPSQVLIPNFLTHLAQLNIIILNNPQG